MGRQPLIPLLLSQQRPDQLARMLNYYDFFFKAHQAKIDQYQSVFAQLTLTEEKIKQTLRILDEQRVDLEKQQAVLLSQRHLREQALQGLRRAMNDKGVAVKQFQRNHDELEKVIAAARVAIYKLPASGGSQPFAKLKGHLPWPLQGQTRNRFGSVRSGHMMWDGLMITARQGTPVQAIHGGRVVFSDWLGGQGLLMILDHGDGYMSLYARNEVLLKEAGEWVQSGDTIARSGDTGGEEAAGLYFEIRYQGSPVDPRLWCK